MTYTEYIVKAKTALSNSVRVNASILPFAQGDNATHSAAGQMDNEISTRLRHDDPFRKGPTLTVDFLSAREQRNRVTKRSHGQWTPNCTEAR